MFQTTFESFSATSSGWKRVARVVSPLTKTPPLKWILTLKSHLTLMLTQRKKKPEVGGMNPKMSVTAETLMRNQKKTRDLQEWEPQPSPPRHDPALPHLRRCLKGCARRHRPPPPAVKSGRSEVLRAFVNIHGRRKRKSRSLDGRPVSPEESTCPICLGEVEATCVKQSCQFLLQLSGGK